MHSIFAATSIILPLLASSAVTPIPSPFVGTILAPTSGLVIASGAEIPFAYQTRNWCEQAYTEFKVSIVPYAPTFDNVTDADGTLQDALHEFGTFTVVNFPTIPPQGIPPPETLTVPDLTELTGSAIDNSELFIAVSDIFLSCPGHVIEEIGVTSVPILYNPISIP
ncbi:unnamed protein product [Somion occarium]|uniref:Uncharacterized protein n=1 Tax=Somion occarium TaxID=3059160 RepID=A0ABP1CM71_9APHY